MGTLFCQHPELIDDHPDGAGNEAVSVAESLVKQAEGARTGGRKLCAISR